MSELKFKNGLEVDGCTECNGSGGYWEGEYGDTEWERSDCCGGTGYDNTDYYQYVMEQEEEPDKEEGKP